MDLYNKRYEVFYSLIILLERIAQQANVKSEQIDEFWRATKEAVFLFDEDIEFYLEIIYKKANDLRTAEEILKPLPIGDERSTKVAEASELCRWFVKQFDVATDKFGKYLKFEQIGQTTRLWCMLSSAFYCLMLSFQKWTITEWTLGRKRSNDNK